jgi:hypothetical protein
MRVACEEHVTTWCCSMCDYDEKNYRCVPSAKMSLRLQDAPAQLSLLADAMNQSVQS